MVFPTLAFLSGHSLGWPIAFTALGATMFALCTLRRARLRNRGVEALQQACRAMLAIEGGRDVDWEEIDPDSPFREELETIASIGRRLSAQSRHFSAIVSAEPECVKVVDRDGSLLEMNPAGLGMIAAPSLEKVQGNCVFDLVVPEHRAAFIEMHEAVIAGESRSLTFQIQGLDGKQHWMDTRAVPLTDSKGRTVHLAITREVTERKRQEDETREARERAEAASLAKSGFLANMSHELRTPLTTILGYASLLEEEDELNNEQSSALHEIVGSAQHLLALISDVLDVSKIEAGHLEVETLPCDLSAIARRVTEGMRPAASEKGISLELTCDEDLPRTVLSDPIRIRQITDNLVSNAVKFTSTGGVHVRVSSSREGVAAGRVAVRISVEDSGVGVKPDELDRLFSPFQQADSSTTRRFGGTGLGLSISRHLARLMGGDVQASSVAGQGSTFTLTMEVDEIALPAAAAGPKGGRQAYSGRVLVVEDNAINQKVLGKLLERRGLEVEVAGDGREGQDMAERAEAPYDLILMDMHMPVQDGYTTTRMLKENGHPAPVVALTASAMAEDRRRCLDAGCDDYLSKPVDTVALDRMLTAFLKPNGVTREAETPRTAV